MLRLLIFLSFIVCCINVHAQRMTIKDGVYLLNKTRAVVYDSLAAWSYSYKSKSRNIESFEKSKLFGYSSLSASFASDILKSISWSESVGNSSIILSEIAVEGFEKDEVLSTTPAFVFYNKQKHLSLNLFDHSAEGYFVIAIGPLAKLIKSSNEQINKPQQKATDSQKARNDSSNKQNKTSSKSNKPKAVMPKARIEFTSGL